MKRCALMLVVGWSMGVSLWAEAGEPTTPRRFGLSWSVSMSGQPEYFTRMSVLGISAVAVTGDTLDVRYRLSLRNGTMNNEDRSSKYYLQYVANKISLGAITRDGLFRPYGFAEATAGVCGESKWKPLTNENAFGFGLGTGLSVFVTDRVSYFGEIGFYGVRRGEEFIPQQGFELGFETHF